MAIYEVELTLIRSMLATNPCNPNVLDQHILNKQRELIAEKSSINALINKYMGALQISKERGELEIGALVKALEDKYSIKLDTEQKRHLIAGDLDKLKETIPELDMTGTTVFFRNDKNEICIGDHMVYGFLKAAAEAIGRTLPQKRGEPLFSIGYTQSLINQHIRIPSQLISFEKEFENTELQRSLRAKTAQGDRIALAKSETVSLGSVLKFELKVYPGSALLQEVELHGETKGIIEHLFDYGQWTGLGQWRSAGYGMFSTSIKLKSGEVVPYKEKPAKKAKGKVSNEG